MYRMAVLSKLMFCCLILTVLASAVSAATLTVTKTADTNDGICDADCSLREAIGAAASGDTIVFSVLFSSTQTIALGGTQLTIGVNLTITGPGSNLLTVSGSSLSRVFQINNGVTASISGLRITGGSTGAGGNGIRNVHITLTAPDGTIKITKTGTFGYYSFNENEVGQTYVISLTSKRFQFPPRVIVLTEDITEVNFVGEEF